MKNDLESTASLYVLGALEPEQTADFERQIRKDPELCALVGDLSDALAAHSLASRIPVIPAPSGLRDEVLGKIDFESSSIIHAFNLREDEGFVVTGPDLKFRWVNPTFSRMCGYTLHELKGKKPGDILQGPLTDSAATQRMRAAIKADVTCQEELVNYHKDGTPYYVSVTISPVFDESHHVKCYVAIEREISNRAAELEHF